MASTSRSQPKPLKPAAVSVDDELSANGLRAYALHPPSWRAPWLVGVENSGYPQFYPTCEAQDEDQLTESAVKSGFTGKTIVQTESFSAHQLIYEKLKGDVILPALARLASDVAERVAARAPTYGPLALRLPQRLTVNEQKKESWVNDLVNPLVPLSKLARSIPHGFRGEKMLEMLCQRQVPVLRAVWYIRANGACDLAAKSRPSYSVSQYTREWSFIVQEFLRKQLAEVVVPELAMPETRAVALAKGKGKGKSVLADNDLRTSWITRFGYTLRLLEALYEEQLIERDAFLRFLIGQVESSNIGQLPFALFLSEEYLGEFLLSEPLSARLAYACFSRLNDMLAEPSTSVHLEEASHTLSSLIRSIFIALPDAFVACPLWKIHSKQLEATMLATPGLEPSLSETIRRDLANLKARDEASSEGTQDAESLEPDELEMIQILDDIAFPIDLFAVHKTLFHKRRRRQPLPNDLNILFSWATTPDRSGAHRAYAVAALIAMELEDPSASDARLDVEAGFIRWIDTGPIYDRWAVGNLLAELIRVRVLSYSLYLQRMIARGETEQTRGVPASMHLHLLRTVPLYGDTGHSLAKRRVALLAGSAARNESKRLLAAAEKELYNVLPGLRSGPTSAGLEHNDCTALLDAVDRLAKDGSHFVLTRQLIPQGVLKILQAAGPDHEKSLSVEDHAVLAQVYLAVEDLWGLLEYLILILSNHPRRELLFHVLDNVESNLVVWTAMAALPNLAKALLTAHDGLKGAGINDRRLVALLRQFGAAGHLEPAALAQLEQDFQGLVLSLSTNRTQAQALPAGLPELQTLVTDGSPQAVGQLATTLWYRYHAFENWGQFVLDAAIRLLAQVPVATVAMFLREINERLPSGIEPCVTRWMAAMSPMLLSATFGGPIATALGLLLGELVLEGTVSAAGTVTLILLPAWSTILATITTPSTLPALDDKSLQLRGLETVASVFASLVGCDPLRDPSNYKSDLLYRQRADSRRASLYTPLTLPDIGRCIAMLAIQQEIWTARAEYEKAMVASSLINHVSSGSSFKMAVARDPISLSTAMLDSPMVCNIPAAQAFRPKLLAALLLILKDGNTATPASLVSTEDWDLFLSGLTIWRLAVSKVEVQACLERLDLDTSLQDSDKDQAFNILACHFLDRVCYGEGHMYLGEQVVRCYHGRASDELVSVAFSRLAEAVDGLAFTASPELRSSSLTTVRCSGRLLDILLQSGSASSRPEPLTQLLVAIKASLDCLLEVDTQPQREVVLHLALLIRIALRCSPSQSRSLPTLGASAATPANPLPEWCELFKDCLIPVAKLAAVLAKECSEESDLSDVLLDTCSHILFVIATMIPSLRLPSLPSFFASDLDFDTLPDSTISRLTRLFGQYNPVVPVTNPWDLVDHADPGPIKEPRQNIGPIDLALFDAKIIEAIPALTALDVVPQSPATSSGHSERGLQTNFDFETPTTGLSLAARDYRRTLAGSKVFQSKYDPAAKQKAKEAEAAATASANASRAAAAAEAQAAVVANTASSTATASRKRKEAPAQEVINLADSSDDEQAPARAPPAKRGRGATSAKSTGRGSVKKKLSRN